MDNIKTLPGGRLDVTGAAAHLGKSKSWLDKERSKGRGPRFRRIGGRVFYAVADLDAYERGCIVETQDTRGAA